ncbi:hypothetical protein LTAR_01748 [Leptolinea tardivitalis]|nr:hypothetical protein LTAR_01748 [Leptolinea tardivitalis]
MALLLTIATGQVFLISAPMVGSKLINQISPLSMDYVITIQCSHICEVGVGGIIGKQCIGCHRHFFMV